MSGIHRTWFKVIFNPVLRLIGLEITSIIDTSTEKAIGYGIRLARPWTPEDEQRERRLNLCPHCGKRTTVLTKEQWEERRRAILEKPLP